MSNYNRKKRRRQEMAAQNQTIQPWISMKAGRRLILLVSIGMAALTAWQVIPARGVPEGIAWGLFFGAMVWLVFEGYYRLNRFLRFNRFLRRFR